jgi:hypothetical protein
MSNDGTFRRPNAGQRIGMVIGNAIVSLIVLKLVFLLLGGNKIELPFGAHWLANNDIEWNPFLFLTPGAAVAYGRLRYNLIMEGRAKGVSWTGGTIYGMLLAFGNVMFACALYGLFGEEPIGGALLGMLFGLLSLLMHPSLLVSMGAFGIIMGLFNAMRAEQWLTDKGAK